MEKSSSIGKTLLKYLLLVAVIGLIGYKSIYFKKLSSVKPTAGQNAFDATAFAKNLWENQLPAKLDSAPVLSDIITAIQTNDKAKETFDKYSSAIGIGNARYFLVKFNGTVSTVNEDDLDLQISGLDSSRVKLATEFVYGNAIRDASGLIKVQDFTSNTDLNNVSEALNKTVRTEVLPSFKKSIKKNDVVEGVGAIEINTEHRNTKNIEIIPIRLTIVQ